MSRRTDGRTKIRVVGLAFILGGAAAGVAAQEDEFTEGWSLLRDDANVVVTATISGRSADVRRLDLRAEKTAIRPDGSLVIETWPPDLVGRLVPATVATIHKSAGSLQVGETIDVFQWSDADQILGLQEGRTYILFLDLPADRRRSYRFAPTIPNPRGAVVVRDDGNERPFDPSTTYAVTPYSDFYAGRPIVPVEDPWAPAIMAIAEQPASRLVKITSPEPGAQVSGAVTLTAEVANGVGGIEFLLDDVESLGEKDRPPYTVNWNTFGSEGPHVLTARVLGDNRRESEPVGVEVVAPTSVPETPLPATASDAVTPPPPLLVWHAVTGATGYDLIVVEPSGTSHEWRLSAMGCEGTWCRSPVLASLPSGTCTWRVRARNARGPSPWSESTGFTVRAR